MRKGLFIIALLFTMMLPAFAFAAETSSDTMILEWKTHKVWKDGENLCMSGEFKNLRSDLKITKLNNFTALITFTNSDGSKYQFIGQPEKLPICKIEPNGTKKLTFNLGKFDG